MSLPPRLLLFQQQLGRSCSLADLARIGQQALVAFTQGRPGREFAAELSATDSGRKLLAVLRKIGVEGVWAGMALVPGTTKKLGPQHAEVKAWLADVLNERQEEGRIEAA